MTTKAKDLWAPTQLGPYEQGLDRTVRDFKERRDRQPNRLHQPRTRWAVWFQVFPDGRPNRWVIGAMYVSPWDHEHHPETLAAWQAFDEELERGEQDAVDLVTLFVQMQLGGAHV